MNIGAVSSLLPSFVQSPANATGSASSTGGLSLADLAAQPAATAQISPAAKFMSMLQQIQQQSPAQFKQVAAKIAAGLEKQAQQAQSDGNTVGAAQLNKLAADFQNSANTGQLPPVQDLQAMGAAAHNQHHPIVNLLSGVMGAAGAALG
ncbi:MAG TPA: hypothetical protein VN893_23465 [Bryobacteraceae bacterium]|nr:hypothetical protein [Bryobacteraceae bacterium]